MNGNKNLLYGENVAKKSLIILSGLVILKATAALVTGMTVLLADTLRTLTDVIGIFASYMGLKLSRKAADKKFEYGYYKAETFAGFIISIIIIYFGYRTFVQAIENFQNVPTGQFHLLGFIVTFLSIIFSFRLSIKLVDAAKKSNSISLMNNAIEKKFDIIEGIVVLGIIAADLYRVEYVESAMTMVMSLMVLKAGLETAKESLFYLLDYWDDPKLLRKIHKVISKNSDVILKIKKIRMRRAGTFIFGEAYIEVSQFSDTVDLREELDAITKKVKELNQYIKEFTIYTHISKSEKIIIAVPTSKGRGLNAEISSTLKKTKNYEFIKIKNGKITNTKTKSINKELSKVDNLIKFFVKEKTNIIIDNGLNSLIYYNLRHIHQIQIYPHFENIKKAKDIVKLISIDT